MGSKPKISVFDLSKASWDAKLPEHEIKPGGKLQKPKDSVASHGAHIRTLGAGAPQRIRMLKELCF